MSALPAARRPPGGPGTDLAWSVALPLPLAPYDFGTPPGTRGAAPVGCRVAVPWQGGVRVGVVLGPGAPGHRLRDAVARLDEGPWLSPAFLAALLEEARLSRVPPGLLLSDLVGVGLSPDLAHRVRAVAGADLSPFGRGVPGPAWANAADFSGALLDAVRAQGLLEEEVTVAPRTVSVVRARGEADVPPEERTRRVIAAREAGGDQLSPKQALAWAWLREHGPVERPSVWAAGSGVSGSVVRAVLERGWAEHVAVPAPPPPAWQWLREHGPAESLVAWAERAGVGVGAVTALSARGWAERAELLAPAPELPLPGPAPSPAPDRLPEAEAWRLHGGRHAERVRALAPRVARALEIGRGVLVLAPDHATLRRSWAALSGVAAASGTGAVLVSGTLGEARREEAWARVRSGEARLVIGTGAALCAPLADPALIVVEEEGSDAYKLPSGSHAYLPELARKVARHAGCALGWIGSAPSAEVLDLPGVVLPPPIARLHVVDYASPPQAPELGPLSRADLRPGPQGYPLSYDLQKVLRQVAERGRQAALLAPRRGYSALLRCPSCEHTPSCAHCDVPLRFHQETRSLTCHQCGYREGLHERCEKCGERMWQARGPGTEWIAREVERLLPGFPVARFDKDRQDDLSALHAGKSGVVVGTQALLSQDAFPNLALIGLTLADTWLNVSDFRASERYHRLLRQLLEWHPTRAPLLVVQTFQAQHPALMSVLDGLDAEHYPQRERQGRALLRYPPFARLAQVEVTARDPGRARAAAEAVAQALFAGGAQAGEVLGPAPSPIARLKGLYPYHLLLRVRDEARLGALLGALDRSFGGRVRVDVHPRGLSGG